MSENPMISVVMSVYNAEKYLDEAIESILNQTYKDFEFIIINDGSTDKSLEIIEKYKNQDDRIVLISRENRGLIFSLNEGIEISNGKYIARMDADDISLPERFEKQIDFMNQNSNIGVCGTAIILYGDNCENKVFKYATKNCTLKTALLFSSIFAHPTVMIRKEVLLSYNLHYNEKFHNAEDFGLWVSMSNYTEFSNLLEPLLKYRVLETSMTRVADKDINERYMVIRTIFSIYLESLSVTNTEEENKLHFNLSVNTRIKENNIPFDTLRNYFEKIDLANKEKKLFNSLELHKVFGKKWLWNIYYRKDFKGFFSKYFFYGLWSLVSK